MTNVVHFAPRNRLWLALGVPLATYAAWLSCLVLPQVLRVVVPEVTRAVLGR